MNAEAGHAFDGFLGEITLEFFDWNEVGVALVDAIAPMAFEGSNPALADEFADGDRAQADTTGCFVYGQHALGMRQFIRRLVGRHGTQDSRTAAIEQGDDFPSTVSKDKYMTNIYNELSIVFLLVR